MPPKPDDQPASPASRRSRNTPANRPSPPKPAVAATPTEGTDPRAPFGVSLLVVAVVCAVASIIDFDPPPPGVDWTTRNVAYYQPLRSGFNQPGPVGYRTDTPAEEVQRRNYYKLLHYVIPPARVVYPEPQRFVVVNAQTPEALDQLIAPSRYRLVERLRPTLAVVEDLTVEAP